MSDRGTACSYRARRAVIERLSPSYQHASYAQKGVILNAVVSTTGYARKYAIRLLNQTSAAGRHRIRRPRLPRYGAEVQQALVQVWKAARCICAKRLIPFVPMLAALLEWHGHLQLTPEQHSQLLCMSAATADRLLQPYRKRRARGHGTTRAGLLLKAHIPLRTFHDWDETQPGFVEMDLVAHGGPSALGSCVYTLTLTDVATGWTECLPLLLKSAEAVLVAVEQARALFPFPILGLDVDNGGEFINILLVAYCQTRQITLTRGRAALKADQCYVEQKNRAVVRAFVGDDRLVGKQAYWQLRELYRAVRLYINYFQPSMKLLSKRQEGETIRRVYDPAKTPLQRLVLSGVLPANRQQEVSQVAQELDPVRLLKQVFHLQQALWYCVGDMALLKPNAGTAFVPFCVHHCLQGASSVSHHELFSASKVSHWQDDSTQGQVQPWTTREQLLALMEQPWPQEVLHAVAPAIVSAESEQRAWLSSPGVLSSVLPVFHAPDEPAQPTTRPRQARSVAMKGTRSGAENAPAVMDQSRERQLMEQESLVLSNASLPQRMKQPVLPVVDRAVTIEQAIQGYLQEQRANGRRAKTMTLP